jgi:cellulose synthase/poly-beta-1,6-N-acetylglucosamine synthase-like glycosyltransferase
MLEGSIHGFALFVLVYFALLNLSYALLALRGVINTVVYAQRLSVLARKDLLEGEAYKPISLLVPAHNEAPSIIAAVDSFLNLHYPEHEVIVVSDGSTDETVERLARAYDLQEEPLSYARKVPTARVYRTYRSRSHPNLTVIEKDHGGKADALNAGLNLARYPLVCVVDADSLLDAPALLGASRRFIEDEHLVAVGGGIRPLNHPYRWENHPNAQGMPRGWLERLQVLEYVRAFFIDRVAWSGLGTLSIISGAFGLFSREALLQVGGYRRDAIGEDMELVLRLHRYYLDRSLPYRIDFVPEPICWTEVPATMRTLRRQRSRWQKGFWQTLWLHRDMLFRRRYGRLGRVTLPYLWVFEGLAPVIEFAGYLLFVVSLLFGLVFPEFILLFFLLAVGYGLLLSQLAIGLETLILGRYASASNRLVLLFAALLEFLGYRQILVVERVVASTSMIRGKTEGEIPLVKTAPEA